MVSLLQGAKRHARAPDPLLPIDAGTGMDGGVGEVLAEPSQDNPVFAPGVSPGPPGHGWPLNPGTTWSARSWRTGRRGSCRWSWPAPAGLPTAWRSACRRCSAGNAGDSVQHRDGRDRPAGSLSEPAASDPDPRLARSGPGAQPCTGTPRPPHTGLRLPRLGAADRRGLPSSGLGPRPERGGARLRGRLHGVPGLLQAGKEVKTPAELAGAICRRHARVAPSRAGAR